jgi:lysophospholipase L1-like esterase
MGCAIAIPCLLAVLLSPGSLAGDEVGLIWADHDRPGNPIFTASFGNGRWTTESFPPSGHFDDNYSPGLAFDPAGVPWAAWAGRRRTESPAIFLSRYASGAWSPERKIGGGAGAWESMPALAFDSPGNGWLAFSREAGSSTEIFCAPILAGAAGTAVLVSPPDVTPDVHPAVACASDGTPIVVWEGWENDRAQVFLSRYRAGRWTKERSLLPGGDEDRIWPEIFLDDRDRPVVSWRVNGESVSYREETDGRAWETVRSQPARASPASLPAGVAAEAWMAGRGGNNRNASWRCFPPSRARAAPAPDARRETSSYRYIGYGDSITYGHDTYSRPYPWYGTLLPDLLASTHPGNSYYLYNEGYPGATTYNMLYGGGDWDCPGIYGVISSHSDASHVLIMGGTNDIAHIGNPALTKSYLGAIIDRTRARGKEPIVATIIPRMDEGGYLEDSYTMSVFYIDPLADEKGCRLADPYREFMQYYDTDYFWNNLYGYPSAWDGIHPAWWEGDYHIALAFQKPFATPTPAPSATPTPQPPAQIFVVSPNGGERMVRGASYPIAWTPSGFPGNIRLHLNKGGGLDHTITSDTPNDGYYDWLISGAQTVGSDYVVIVQSAAFPYLADSSDSNFSIGDPTTPTPLSPTPSPSPSPTPLLAYIDSGDYDGDGSCDLGLFRAPAGFWAIRDITRVYRGTAGDVAACGDYDNDGRTEVALFRPSRGMWSIHGLTTVYYGASADIPVPGDWDGDGFCDVGVFKPSSGLWAIKDITRVYFGQSGDIPVAYYKLGTREKNFAVWRPGSGLWSARSISSTYLGVRGDFPVPADYSGDGFEEEALFRRSSYLWTVAGLTRVGFGASGDYPAPADFDGDGSAEMGIFRPASGFWSLRGLTALTFGQAGDLPVCGRLPWPVAPTPTPAPSASPTTPTPLPPTPTPIPPTPIPTLTPPPATPPPTPPAPTPPPPTPIPTLTPAL